MGLATIQYFSQSLQKASTFLAVFPDDPELTPPWSVFVLLHGLSDDQTIWQRRSNIERYAANLPMLVVMPDGGRGWYTNAADGDRYEDDLIVDVLGQVERLFPVRLERTGRVIGGLSMGGYGAVKIAMKHPDLFAGVSSHSGLLGAVRMPEIARSISPEFERVFGPSPAGGPEDPFSIAERLDPAKRPAMRLDCGLDDFLLEQNRAFHAHLEAIGFTHEYHELPGGHDWAYWDWQVREALAFHARTLGLTS